MCFHEASSCFGMSLKTRGTDATIYDVIYSADANQRVKIGFHIISSFCLEVRYSINLCRLVSSLQTFAVTAMDELVCLPSLAFRFRQKLPCMVRVLPGGPKKPQIEKYIFDNSMYFQTLNNLEHIQ